jgi:hypothetical protein
VLPPAFLLNNNGRLFLRIKSKNLLENEGKRNVICTHMEKIRWRNQELFHALKIFI